MSHACPMNCSQYRRHNQCFHTATMDREDARREADALAGRNPNPISDRLFYFVSRVGQVMKRGEHTTRFRTEYEAREHAALWAGRTEAPHFVYQCIAVGQAQRQESPVTYQQVTLTTEPLNGGNDRWACPHCKQFNEVEKLQCVRCRALRP